MLSSRFIFTILVSLLGGSVISGYNSAVVNTPASLIQAWYEQCYEERGQSVDITLLWSITTSIYYFSGMLSALSFGRIADKIGRRKTLWLNNILSLISASCCIISVQVSSPELLIASRVIIGLNCGVSLGLTPLYLSELSSKSLRGPVTASSYLGCSVGILLAQILSLDKLLGTADTWQFCFAFSALFSVVQFLLLPLCPESPRYLLLTERNHFAAQRAFIWLYGKEVGEAEYENLHSEIQQKPTTITTTTTTTTTMEAKATESSEVSNKESKGTESSDQPIQRSVPLLHLLRKQYRLPMFVAIVSHVAQQWSGINAVLTYSGEIFKGVGIPEELVQYCTLSTGFSSLISVALCVPLFGKFGRRTLILTSISTMTLALCLLTFCGVTSSVVQSMNYVAILAVVIFIFGYAPIATSPPVLVSEMFLQDARGTAFSVAIGVRWGSNILILFAFPYLQTWLHDFTFLVFAAIMSLCLFALWLYLPETKGKTLLQIQRIVSNGFVPVYKQRVAALSSSQVAIATVSSAV